MVGIAGVENQRRVYLGQAACQSGPDAHGEPCDKRGVPAQIKELHGTSFRAICKLGIDLEVNPSLTEMVYHLGVNASMPQCGGSD